jgi:hypothetical protein
MMKLCIPESTGRISEEGDIALELGGETRSSLRGFVFSFQ